MLDAVKLSSQTKGGQHFCACEHFPYYKRLTAKPPRSWLPLGTPAPLFSPLLSQDHAVAFKNRTREQKSKNREEPRWRRNRGGRRPEGLPVGVHEAPSVLPRLRGAENAKGVERQRGKAVAELLKRKEDSDLAPQPSAA